MIKPFSIRARLTLWYFGVLAFTLALFSLLVFFATRHSVYQAVDSELRQSVASVHAAIARQLPEGEAEMQDELSELGEERGAGDYVQVARGDGSWIYRSPAMMRLNISFIGGRTAIQSLWRGNTHLRLISANVTAGGQLYRIEVGSNMREYDEALGRLAAILMFCVPGLLALGSLGGYWMSQRALSPVQEITDAARRIGARNLSSRLAVPQTRDELQHLSETLNEMLARLEGSFQRITQFTADASHELRTPVSVMRARAELALRRPRDEAEYREALSVILGELEWTSDLLERLLLLARADAGVEELERMPVDLSAVARDAVETMRPLAEGKAILVKEMLPSEAVMVNGDFRTLERLVLILMENAVKYTPERGCISLTLAAKGALAIISVQDSGIGIPPEELPHIFERFYRADKARSREAGGAGLGLSIARWIANVHRGRIEVESEPEKGSTFSVFLPICGAHEA